MPHAFTRRRLLDTAVGLGIVASNPLSCRANATARADEPIPRRLFFADPARTVPRISPDGRILAWLEPRDGVLNLVVAPVGDVQHPRQLTHATGRSLSTFFMWAYTNKHLVFFRDEAGDENYRPFSVALDTGETLPLLPAGGRSFVQERAPRIPNEMLFGHNGRDRKYFDLIRVDVTTGESRPVFQNPGFNKLHTAGDFEVRFASRIHPDGSGEVMQWSEDARWTYFMYIPPEDVMATGLQALSSDGRSAFILDSRKRDKAALIEIDIATRESRVLAEDPDADVVSAFYEPGNARPLAATSVAARRQWHLIDPAWAFDLDHFQAAQGEGEVAIAGMSHDRNKVVLTYSRSDASAEFRLYDRHKQATTALFKARDDLDGLALRPMRPVTIPASDGVPLPGYLTLPADGFHDGPVVLLIHGGPYARDEWGYSGTHQWLASRGYGVLAVNYRGSTGFGKHFVALADQGWGGRMQDDLTDAAAWLVAQGIADPKRLGFYGGSYGGYAALMAATRTPTTFACIVDLFGPSNLVTMMQSVPAYWGPWMSTWKQRLADPDTDEGRQWLAERSPLTHVDRITCPLLIGQGLRDVRVKPRESQQMVQAMEQHGLPVTYVTFSDEGHGFVRQENRVAFAAIAEAFLAQHLGGLVEPVNNAFNGSTVKFEAGKTLITGLG